MQECIGEGNGRRERCGKAAPALHQGRGRPCPIGNAAGRRIPQRGRDARAPRLEVAPAGRDGVCGDLDCIFFFFEYRTGA